MALKTDFVDEILSSERKYTLTENDDGTISLEDATTYQQVGTKLTAAIMNAITNQVNTNTTDIDNLKESGGGSGGGGSVTVDSALSSTSTNPVQNKVITAKISEIETTIGDIETALDTINGVSV